MIWRILLAEALGTCLLVATVVGSGIMAEQLAGGNVAIALLGNTIATGAVLYLLICLLGPVSGAHFNPVVTWLNGSDAPRWAVTLTQIGAAIAGTLLAHLMFGHAPLVEGIKVRTGAGQYLGEFVATFGLLLAIRMGVHHRPHDVPAIVALWIVAAYWFTSSTSFANPAVTIARAFTDTFAGIRPLDVPAFVLAQCVGAWTGHRTGGWLIQEKQA